MCSSDLAYQVQFLGSSIIRTNDFNQIVFRYDQMSTYKVLGAQFNSRYPLFGSWRFGPRLLAERKVTDTGFTSYFYSPYGHLDYQRNGRLLEFEAGLEKGMNPSGLELGNTTRLFVSAGYRINF